MADESSIVLSRIDDYLVPIPMLRHWRPLTTHVMVSSYPELQHLDTISMRHADDSRHPTPWLQVGALPRGATVEVQPVLADPGSTVLEDSDDDCDDEALVEVTGEGRCWGGSAGSGCRMQGWMGRLRHTEASAELTIGGRRVRLELRALSVRWRFSRCQVTASFATTTRAAGQQCYGSLAAAATDLADSSLGGKDSVLAPAEAEAIAAGLTTLLVDHLAATNLRPRATSSLRAYHVGRAGTAVADALNAAQPFGHDNAGELVRLPVVAVGMSTSLTAFVLLECTACRPEKR